MTQYNKNDIPLRVKFSIPASSSFGEIFRTNKMTAQQIYGQINHRLPYDPYPDIKNIGETFHSEIIKNLAKEGYDIWKLKSSDFFGFRVFYIVDEDCSLIYILEIIPRNDDTYKSSSPHYTTVKRLYVEYFANKTNYGCPK